MPLYDFVCDNCLSRQEVQRTIANRDRTKICRSCNKPMRRQYQAPPIVFRGKGFYSTDKITHKNAKLDVRPNVNK